MDARARHRQIVPVVVRLRDAARQIARGIVINVSKRRDALLSDLAGRFTRLTGAHATINTNDPSSGRNQLVIATGVRHRF